MTRLQLSTFAGAALGIGVAQAADLSGRTGFDAPITAPAYDWSGWYSGSGVPDAGGSRIVSALGASSIASNPGMAGGLLHGFHGGFNLQNGGWVFGVETDARTSAQEALLPGCRDRRCSELTSGYSDNLPWFGTARGRIGLTPASGWLFYATGGVAYGDVKAEGAGFPARGVAPYGVSESGAGWTVGPGVEGVLPSDWSWKLEYLYLKPEDAGQAAPGPGLTFTANGHGYDNLVRAGLDCRFGWDGPVIDR